MALIKKRNGCEEPKCIRTYLISKYDEEYYLVFCDILFYVWE